jgi:hypothetical protein
MPKVTIKFEQDKDEDLGSLMEIVKGTDLFSAIYETARDFRTILKHGEPYDYDKGVREGVSVAQSLLVENLEAYDIHTDFGFYRNYDKDINP